VRIITRRRPRFARRARAIGVRRGHGDSSSSGEALDKESGHVKAPRNVEPGPLAVRVDLEEDPAAVIGDGHIDGGEPKEKPETGAPRTLEIRYRIKCLSKDQTVHWVYCVGGRTNPDGKPVKPTEPLKPDEVPTKRGTYFRIILSPRT